jgi:mannose-6-phosphate isomerase-like protein (cupin superfamily)
MELDVGQPLVLPPGEGDKALLDELFVSVMDATMNVEPHVHLEHVDSFFVLEGEFTFERAGEEVTLRCGDYALAPPLLVHGFRPGTARVLNLHAPGRYWVRNRIARREGRRAAPEEYDSHDPPADGGLPRSEAIVVQADEGELVENDDRQMWILAARPELCVFVLDAAPGYVGPHVHLHKQHVDSFYVMEGELDFELDGERASAPAGTSVAATPGVVHTFRNAGDGRVRFLNVHAPGVRFDEYMRRQNAGEDGRRFHESFDVYEVSM